MSLAAVGYTTTSSENKLNYAGGFSFIPVGGGDTVLLKEVAVKNMNPEKDSIQYLKAEGAAKETAYTFVSDDFIRNELCEDPTDEEELAELKEIYGGWWVAGWWDSEDRETYGADNQPIPVGKGFLTLNASRGNVLFTSAGQAPVALPELSVDIEGLNPMIANYIPRDLKLDEITVDNMNPEKDSFQTLKPEGAAKETAYTYVSLQFIKDELCEDPNDPVEVAEMWDTYGGWWIAGWWDSEDRETYGAGGVTMKVGEAYLGLIASRNKLTVNFPSSIPEKDAE